ncbi:alpha-alpha-trehalose-phosphate synthase subunit [Apiospora arundinis]
MAGDLSSTAAIGRNMMMMIGIFIVLMYSFAEAAQDRLQLRDTTAVSVSAISFNPTASEPTCVSSNVYVTKAGDTCDSVAQAHNVSSATMFYINPTILDCSAIREGTSLCLPLPCDTVRTVKDGEDCTDIAIEYLLSTVKLIAFNSQLKRDCSNLHGADPSWGSTLCPASNFPVNGGKGGIKVQTEHKIVEPPSDAATVAANTSLACSAWYVHNGEMLQCAQICLSNYITFRKFTAANPSLKATTCDGDLVKGNAYCVAPIPEWVLGTEGSDGAPW